MRKQTGFVPRKAFPDPQIETIVDNETQAILAQIDIEANRCKKNLTVKLVVSGIVISMRQVVVNPANTAACVAIAPKLSVNKFSSFSLSLIADWRRLTSSSDLSAANMTTNLPIFVLLTNVAPEVH